MTNEHYSTLAHLAHPKIAPALDPDFAPAVLANRAFRNPREGAAPAEPLVIGLERSDGSASRYETSVYASSHPRAPMNLPYVERIVKFLLWQKGGCKLTIGGPNPIGEYIRKTYSPAGRRAFDFHFMGLTTYEQPFEVIITDADNVPTADETSVPVGRHFDGCRIGFDLGASDRKAAAVVDGESVFTEEVVWDPRSQSDPQYHFDQIMAGLRAAAEKMPRVDAIGGSSAGVIINNRPMIASLFRGVPKELFESRVKNLFIEIGREWGVPIEVANDGDVTALAGAMSLDENGILGVAMGSSEAAGYVNADGNITGWLNELAFAPIDYNPNAPADEWSGDIGCGAQYLTQQAVFRLARKVGIALDESAPAADQLESVQELLESGNDGAFKIWQTIGFYTGYAIAHYADFYDIRHMLILGRVTSGAGGTIIMEKAKEVLAAEFPELLRRIKLHLPDEQTRRIGQAVAAASLPIIR